MGKFKDVVTEETNPDAFMVVVPDKSPVQQIGKTEIEAAIGRVRFTVPGGENMSTPHLTIIAQESILYRTVPGRDVHYFVSKGQLQKIYDYKYLKNFATFKEQLLSGDESATLDDKYYVLTEDEKIEHNVEPDHIAAKCVLTTARERRQFASEVRMWVEIGFGVEEAAKMARETYGPIGTEAVGVVNPNELDSNGKPKKPPFGWSHLQYAEKLAFKNAVNRKYGIPTADEMQAMAYRMANRAMPEHWQNVDPTQPIDIQARTADLEAIASEIEAESEGMTAEDHEGRLEENVTILRGEDDDDQFIAWVLEKIPYFQNEDHVRAVMVDLKLAYDPIEEDGVFARLEQYAKEQADLKEQ
jgi:hypothetical protein